MIDNVAIVRSVRDADGSIVDFLIEFVNQTTLDRADASPARLMGGHLLQLFPAWRNSGLFRLFVRVVETGEPFVGERLTYSSALPEGVRRPGYWNVRVAKLDDGYIAAWRDVTSAVRAEESIHQAEALAERERMATEILQRAALPGKLPTVSGVALGAYHQPAVSAMPIGGDWYDVVVPTRGRIVLVIADVAGHGPAAAGFMLQLRNYLRTIATDVDQPDELLRRANRTAFTLHGRDSLLTTCCVVILEVERGELHWALAGHPPPLVRSGNGAARMLVSHPDPPLGMSSDTHYAGYTERVSVGDRLVLYTDGLVESRQSSIDEGIAALRRAVDASRDLDPQRASELLANQLSSRQDDVALIVVDVLGQR
jgi:serine phosphatase RsbU (regulator of sigma subunit)